MNRITKMIPDRVTQRVGRTILVGKKNSPTILFVGGIVGVVATTVLASRATLKVEEITDEAKSKLKLAEDAHDSGHVDYSDEDYRQDVTIIYSRAAVDLVKLYGPAFLVGFLSVAALTKSHHILSKRNAGLTAAYAVLDRSYAEYRKRVKEEYGEDHDRLFRYGVDDKPVVEQTEEGPKEVKKFRVNPMTPSGYARFFDELCTSWSRTPEYNLLFLRCQQNYANDLLRSRGHIFLNEVYDMVGIERSSSGSVVGWVIGEDGDNFVDFGVFDGNNPRARDFVNGREGAILLDFNVDGVIYDKIERHTRGR